MFYWCHSIVMYGVTLPDNTIVASGSVVTKSITESGKIIGGNSVRVIGDWDKFALKNGEYAANIGGLSREEKKKALLEGKIKLVSR